jgi:hypothetical protein
MFAGAKLADEVSEWMHSAHELTIARMLHNFKQLSTVLNILARATVGAKSSHAGISAACASTFSIASAMPRIASASASNNVCESHTVSMQARSATGQCTFE